MNFSNRSGSTHVDCVEGKEDFTMDSELATVGTMSSAHCSEGKSCGSAETRAGNLKFKY